MNILVYNHIYRMIRYLRKKLKVLLAWLLLALVVWNLIEHYPSGNQRLSGSANHMGFKQRGKIHNMELPGYQLAGRINEKCNVTGNKKRVFVAGSYSSDATQVCAIWKVGTTFIKRLYMMKRKPEFNTLVNPYNIRYDKPYQTGHYIAEDHRVRLLFVRNPYHRLISGYVDKLVAPNPKYWYDFGREAIRLFRKNATKHSIKCGHDLQFNEYIKYVILRIGKESRPDGHFDVMTRMCKPCDVQYDFVGRLESFSRDSMELVRLLDLPNETQEILASKGSQFAADDAIEDTLHQPLFRGFQRMYQHCMTVHEAMQRAWLKLQMRGLIGRGDFPVSKENSLTMTEREFVELTHQTRQYSTLKERKELKHEYFVKLYSTVPIEDLEEIRKIYEPDFKMFEYNDRPSELFSRR